MFECGSVVSEVKAVCSRCVYTLFFQNLGCLSSVPFTEKGRLNKIKLRYCSVAESWRCVLLFSSQFYSTVFESYWSHNLSFFALRCHNYNLKKFLTLLKLVAFLLLYSDHYQYAQKVSPWQAL